MNSDTTPSQPGSKKVLSTLDVILMTACALLGLETIIPLASSGAPGISWLVLVILLFFLPFGLITAELSSAYPQQGGISAWVRRGLGPHWSGRAAWFYWANNAIWVPSVLLVFSGLLKELFFPGLGLWAQIGVALLLTWLLVLLNILPLAISKIFILIGGLLEIVLLAILGIGGIVKGLQFGVANDLSWPALLPTWDAGLALLPVIVYTFIGLEVMFAAGSEIRRPQRNPLSLVITGLLVALLYLLFTVGLLMAVPAATLAETGSTISAFNAIFNQPSLANPATRAFGAALLLSLLTFVTVWTLGANRVLAASANYGDLPAALGKQHPTRHTPLTASWLTGAVSSAAVVIYGLLSGDAQELFSFLFDSSSLVMLLAYILLVVAFAELRRIEPDTHRPYKVPVGYVGAVLLASLVLVFTLIEVAFFIWTPGQPVDLAYAVIVLGTTLLILILGEVLIRRAQRK